LKPLSNDLILFVFFVSKPHLPHSEKHCLVLNVCPIEYSRNHENLSTGSTLVTDQEIQNNRIMPNNPDDVPFDH